jgi:hypothetical protein
MNEKTKEEKKIDAAVFVCRLPVLLCRFDFFLY